MRIKGPFHCFHDSQKAVPQHRKASSVSPERPYRAAMRKSPFGNAEKPLSQTGHGSGPTRKRLNTLIINTLPQDSKNSQKS